MAGVLHAIGFTHVIATLWEVPDDFAPYLTDHAYSAMMSDDVLRAASAAAALHHAVRAGRAARPDTPTTWAAYVHSGP